MVNTSAITGGERGRCIAYLLAANMNVTTDQGFTFLIPVSVIYIPRRIVVTNASISLTTAVGGLYTGQGKSGTVVVANTQVYSALSAATKFVDLTLAAAVTTDTVAANTSLFVSLTTAQGAAATADFYLFGDLIT